YNLPYNMAGVLVSSGTSLAALQAEPGVTIETGGGYISCQEAYEAGRGMGSGTYQIVNSGSALIENIGCPMNY
ncbi:MAG: hypothetical protein PHH16_05320, partial [Candidatus Gracilibacteria bacterium]|nr:hypothetical protein [Candidatus Gracilibacteria bacterium]